MEEKKVTKDRMIELMETHGMPPDCPDSVYDAVLTGALALKVNGRDDCRVSDSPDAEKSAMERALDATEARNSHVVTDADLTEEDLQG